MFDFDVPSRLLNKVARFDRDDLLVKLAGLSLDPLYQDNHLRIFTLAQLALARADGTKNASATDIADLLNALLEHDSGRKEDPSEDVFVASVTHPQIGDMRIFLGNFPGSDFHLQRLVDAFVESSANTEDILAPCVALLRLSEAIAERCAVLPGSFMSGEIRRERWPRTLPPLVERGRKAWFSEAELADLAIAPADLKPFILTQPESLLDERCGENEMMARPIVVSTNGLGLPVPSLVSPAIRLYLAQIVARRPAIAREIQEHLYTWLFGRWLIYDLPTRGHQPIDSAELTLNEPDFDMFGDYAHGVFRFDADKAAHLIWLAPDWSDPPAYALHRISPAPVNFTPNLNHHVLKCVGHLRARFARGLTIIVYDSPGWNVDFRVVAEPGDDWYVLGLTANAFALLLADPTFDLLALWKMKRQQRELSERDYIVGLYPDLINLWAVWQGLGGSFRVPGVDMEAVGGLGGDTGAIQPWVAAGRAFRGTHGAPAVDGSWERVERYLTFGAPSEELAKPIFFQPLAISSNTMRYVVEGDGAWWVTTARPAFSNEDRQYLFLLWQTVSEWMLLLQRHPLNPLAGRLERFELRLLPVPEQIADAPDHFELKPVQDYPVVTLITPPRLIQDMAAPGNAGEAALVNAIAEAAIMASNISISDAQRGAWVAEITNDPALKMMHVTWSADTGLAVDLVADRPSFRPLSSHDLIEANFNACSLPDAEQLPTSSTIDDPRAIQAFLNNVVDARWQRCRTMLAELDRADTLKLVSRQIEAALRERALDARGALARTRYYAASQAAGWTIHKMSERDMAFRAYRVLAEMAVCECPLGGGRTPGLTDIDAIAAEIFHLVIEAEYSDAIKYKLVSGHVERLPDGSLQLGATDAQISMPDYLRASLQEVVDVDVESYAEHFEQEAQGSDGVDPNDPFLIAYEAEHGISLFDAVQVSLALQSICIERQTHVIALRRSDIIADLSITPTTPSAEQLNRFLQAFGLATRTNWDVPPPGFDGLDIWPWLFERRQSLMLRPILIIDNSDDPMLIYGVRQLELATRYAAHLLEEAIVPRERLRSNVAKQFHDTVVAQRGSDFEAEIADLARAAGWHVIPSIEMKRLGAPKTLGEIDVLAVHEPTGIWLLVECKWVGPARTAREVMNWMQGFHGKGGDRLDHHLKRVEWVRANSVQAATRLSLSAPATVTGRIVATQPVPLTFAAQLPSGADTLTKRQFVEALATILERLGPSNELQPKTI